MLFGIVLGAISHVYNSQWSGIVVMAVGITAAVALTMYTIYALRIIKVTDRFRKTVIGATIGVVVFYGIVARCSACSASPSRTSAAPASGASCSAS